MPIPFNAGPWPHNPGLIEHLPGVGWIRNGQKVKNFKPHYTFVWPKDGPRGTKIGRFKDILTGSGPDVFVTASGAKGQALHDRPLRSRWSKCSYMEEDPLTCDLRNYQPGFFEDNLKEPFWVRSDRDKRPDLRYDFYTRKYRRVAPSRVWSDARYVKGRGGNVVPQWARHHQWDSIEGHPFGSWQQFMVPGVA